MSKELDYSEFDYSNGTPGATNASTEDEWAADSNTPSYESQVVINPVKKKRLPLPDSKPIKFKEIDKDSDSYNPFSEQVLVEEEEEEDHYKGRRILKTEKDPLPLKSDETSFLLEDGGRHQGVVESSWSTEIDEGKTFDLEEKKHSSKNMLLFFIVGTVALVGMAIYGFNTFFTANEVPTATTVSLSSYVKDPASVLSRNVNIKLSGTGFASDKTAIALANQTPSSTDGPCVVKNVNEYCTPGKLGTYNVYYSLDLTNSPVFSKSNTVTELKSNKFKFAGVVNTDYAGVVKDFVVVINADGSGWFLEGNNNFTKEEAQTLLDGITIK